MKIIGPVSRGSVSSRAVTFRLFGRSVGQYTICTVGSVGRCDFVYTVVFGRSLPAHCSAPGRSL